MYLSWMKNWLQKKEEWPCRQLQNRSRTWQELQWSIEGEGNTFHGSSAASLVGFLEEFLKPRSLFVLCIGYCYWVHYGNWNALLGLLGPKGRFGEKRRRWEWGAFEPAKLQRQRCHGNGNDPTHPFHFAKRITVFFKTMLFFKNY